jgi:hypothetical protein
MEALDARAVVNPVDAIHPAHRPTCRSGSPPRAACHEAADAMQG